MGYKNITKCKNMKYNFLNFPAIRFKRPSEKTLEAFSHAIVEKFDKYEDEGETWSSECFDAVLDGNFEKLKQLEKGRGRFSYTDLILDYVVDNFTLKETNWTKGVFENFSKDVVNNSRFYKKIDFDFDKGEMILHTIYGKLKINTLTKMFPSMSKNSDYMQTKNRHQHCHQDSVAMLKSIKSDSCRLATGYISTSGEGNYYLHSWIEIDLNGEPSVIDTTRNIVMSKRDYYLMRNVKGSVHKISRDKYLEDEPKIKYICRYNGWFSKLYLANSSRALEVYKILVQMEQRKKENDPLYQAAKHFYDSMTKYHQTPDSSKDPIQKQG